MSHADVVISNVTYEVSRAFPETAKAILKHHIPAEAAAHQTLPTYQSGKRKQ